MTLKLETNQMRINEKHEDHNHSPKWDKIKVNKFRQFLFTEAEKVTDKNLIEIFSDAILRPEFKPIAHKLKYKKFENGMRARRKRKFPNLEFYGKGHATCTFRTN